MQLQDLDCIIVYRVYSSDNRLFAITRQPSTKMWFVALHDGEETYYLNYYIPLLGNDPKLCLTKAEANSDKQVCMKFEDQYKAFEALLKYCNSSNIALFTQPQK